MDYYNVSLHAISKDPNVYDGECIYILTDPHIDMLGSGKLHLNYVQNKFSFFLR
jgi:hypothetical protein